uniref:Serine/threonine-protein phosphatase PGAM5, mitochondrial n=1 Tax=Peronospora matthiolae TaxID=2874970 RepID=A0AAV1T9Z6_9STRA
MEKVVAPAGSNEETRPSQLLNSRVSIVDHFTAKGDELSMTSGPRSSKGTLLRRPSTVTDPSDRFLPIKIHGVQLRVFIGDILMEGELTKKGASLLYTWTNRMVVLRGHILSYYSITRQQRYGTLQGTYNIANATITRPDNLSFCLQLVNGSTCSFGACNVQTLMDWMTAIAIAADALIVKPPTELSLVDHSRTTHILLVRHGHYASSEKPATDVQGSLTELGLEQARATGAFLYNYLAERMVMKRLSKVSVYHSGIRRAVETAERIEAAFPEGYLQLVESKLFREAWPGNPLPTGKRQQLTRERLDNMVSDCARLKVAYRIMFRHLIPQDLEADERELSEEDQKHTGCGPGWHVGHLKTTELSDV